MPNFGTAAVLELAQHPQWVRWRRERRQSRRGKADYTKVPYRVDGATHASSTDASTWSTFDAVVAAHGSEPWGEGGGVGYVFAPDGGLVGIDLDACRNAYSGAIAEWARVEINSLSTYTEISPSGTGVKLFAHGVWPDTGRKVYPPVTEQPSTKKPAIEVYDRARYFTVTGLHLDGTPETIEPRQDALDALYARYFVVETPRPRTTTERSNGDAGVVSFASDGLNLPPSAGLTDDELLDLARTAANGDKFCRLFDHGDISGYPSDSEADAALVGLLLFYTANDLEQLDRLFRQSALQRNKWNRADYRRRTIRFAASGRTDFYAHYVAPNVEVGPAPTSSGPGPHVSQTSWPAPINAAAYVGPIGAVVRGIEPETEADSAALFAHALTIAGGYLGAARHGRAGDMPHPPRFFCAVVGETSKGRKGSSAAPFRRVSKLGKEPVRIASGLSSGEGLVHQVRDQLEKFDPKTKKFETTDPGVTDKRLVVIEGELATLLRRMEREGNSISAMLRDAWDFGDLETLVKINPTRATGAHINVVAHITLEELRQYLQPTEISSGFANRVLWFAVKRSKFLPRGGRIDTEVLQNFADALDRARVWATTGLGHSGSMPDIEWSDAAGSLWDEGYATLSTGVPGLYGQATQRAEAQVLRMSVLYAVLDCSPYIESAHLQAALEIWRYANESARWIFGDRTGNPIADTILEALRTNGELTRTQISALFQRHMRADRIAAGLALLLKHGLARSELRGPGAQQAEWWLAL